MTAATLTRILLVEDDRTSAALFSAYAQRIEEREMFVSVVDSVEDAQDELTDGRYDAVFLDLTLKTTNACLLYTSPSPRDQRGSRMPSSA